jgi:hypothetical protein
MQSTASWQRLLRTSNQTEVVSLPVNRYWPTNIVAPGFTAYKEQTNRIIFFFLFSALHTELSKDHSGKTQKTCNAATNQGARDVVAYTYKSTHDLTTE